MMKIDLKEVEKVYINIKGIDISQAIRPLVHSFFGNLSYEYEYGEETTKEADIKIYATYTEDSSLTEIYKAGTCIGTTTTSPMPKDIAEYRYAAGRDIYKLLNELTGKELPWGVLVGIRPTKHVYEALEKGIPEDEIKKRFKETFLASDEKTEVSVDIAKREMNVLNSFDYKNGYSLYIGIPFCPTTCLYCSFTSYPVKTFGKYMYDYMDALEKEMAYASTALNDKKLNTIYIGGGTPTALDETCLKRLMELVYKYFPVADTLEFCVEAGRPDSLNPEKLRILKEYGVTRISINPQTLVQRTLDVIGRKHTVEQVYDAFAMAREAGHNNINLDMIIGLNGESPEDVEATLKGVSELNPESLTVHTLAIKRAARLNIENERYKGSEATGIGHMQSLTVSYAKEHGYEPYYLYRQKNMAENLENIGYSKPGLYGLYNILIMEEKHTILALGAGASTKYVFKGGERIEREENVKSLTDYITRIDEMIERKRSFLTSMREQDI